MLTFNVSCVVARRPVLLGTVEAATKTAARAAAATKAPGRRVYLARIKSKGAYHGNADNHR